MKNVNFQKWCIGLSFLFFLGCMEKDVLPDSTQVGADTIGFKIDGKVWLPKKGISVTGDGGPPVEGHFTNTKALFIKGKRGVYGEVVYLKIDNFYTIGTYKLSSTDDGIPATSYWGSDVDDTYLLFSSGKNDITVTKYDTVNMIASGTFSLQLKGKDKQKIINLTDGVFDVKFRKN